MIREVVVPDRIQKAIKRLPVQIRKKLYWCIDMLLSDERHPSLRNKKLEGTDFYWEFSITMQYRCLYRRHGDKVVLVAVGTHDDVL